jgi:tetratricopeptide (TPR) repeat protein
MAQRRRSYLWVGALTCFLVAGLGFWILLTPNNAFTKAFQSPISNSNERIITGPYPLASDFRELQDHGVTTVVSLLDPAIPYENILLKRERKNAHHYGMKFFNFPMVSVLGYHAGDDYTTNATRAARLIDSLSQDHIYVHCYLGLHRVVAVSKMLVENGVHTGMYTVRQAYRSHDASEMDSAISYYQVQNYEYAIRQISSMKQPEAPALLVRGWSYYHLHDIPRATQDFQRAHTLQPDLLDAESGLGYCDLTRDMFDSARIHFTHVLASAPMNAQAEAGMGIVAFRSGNRTMAQAYLQKSIALDSTNSDARDALAKLDK